jgi:hypothetical protein
MGPALTKSESSSSRMANESTTTPVTSPPLMRPMYIVPRFASLDATCAWR